MNFKQKIATGICAVVLTLESSALGASIFQGLRGPTHFQLDSKVEYAKTQTQKAATETVVLKYWDGKEFGKWAFLSVPYKQLTGKTESSNGLGDITLGFGPRFQRGNLHGFGYTSVTLPAGDDEEKPPLGNGRTDVGFGAILTYYDPNSSFEITGSSQYMFTGENEEHINPSERLNFGLLFGGQVFPNVRYAAGVEGSHTQTGDYDLRLRVTGRYTFSKNIHVELIGDRSVANDHTQPTNAILLQVRYNF